MDARTKFAIEADLASLGYRGWAFHFRWVHPIANLQRELRLAEMWMRRTGWFARMMAKTRELRCRRLSMRMGAAIHPGVAGPGLSIAHVPGIVLNKKATIGRNCRLHQNVTVGSANGQAPTIGDDVWIGAGAVIVGGITVGDRAQIGANAVVVNDVPAGVTVGGIPAKVISQRSAETPDGCLIAAARLGVSDPTRRVDAEEQG